jgi:hypothetical protein
MIAGAGVGLLAWIVWTLNYTETKTLFPDSHEYLKIAQGQKVPGPFWHRWLVPRLLGYRRGWVWEYHTLVACVVLHAAMAHWYGIAAAWMLAPMHIVSWNIRGPVQVDLLPLALCVVGARLEHPAAIVALGLCVGAMRQQAPLLLALLTGSPWALVGIVAPLGGLAWRRAVDPAVDNPWIVAPLQTTLAVKGRTHTWANPRIMLLPWGLALPLAMATPSPTLWLSLAMGYLPLLAASDHARIYLWAAPVVIASAVQAPIPAAWWPAILLAHATLSVYSREVHYTQEGVEYV